MTVNLKGMFEEVAKERGDTLQSAVVGWHDDDEKKYDDYGRKFPVEPWAEASNCS